MYIFYCASVEIFGEVMGVFLTEKHSPDASTGRYVSASGEVYCGQSDWVPRVRHRTHRVASGPKLREGVSFTLTPDASTRLTG